MNFEVQDPMLTRARAYKGILCLERLGVVQKKRKNSVVEYTSEAEVYLNKFGPKNQSSCMQIVEEWT